MSVVATALILAGIVVLLIKWKIVRPLAAVVCIVFGLVLGVTPIGGVVLRLVTAAGDAVASQLGAL